MILQAVLRSDPKAARLADKGHKLLPRDPRSDPECHSVSCVLPLYIHTYLFVGYLVLKCVCVCVSTVYIYILYYEQARSANCEDSCVS